jgi:hypothetical protein
MILLSSPDDTLELLTGAAVSTDYYVVFKDEPDGVLGQLNGNTTTATTTVIMSGRNFAPVRTVKYLSIKNRHASTPQTVTLKLDIATVERHLTPAVTLAAGEMLEYTEGRGWALLSAGGVIKTIAASATTFGLNVVTLASPVANAEAVANTLASVTGLSFAVVAAETYWFKFTIPYTSAATTTGSRWTILGPTAPTALNYVSRYTIDATSETVNYATAYGIPAASNATSLAAGNVALIEGVIKPSVDGTVIAQFASEVTVSAVTALAGATLQWMRVV